ncbi:MAG: DUF4212 domain-containing protein [Gammaproteobacteria bacterium]
MNETESGGARRARTDAYWRANLRVVAALLAIWFAVSFGCGILFVDALNTFSLFGFKLGFWFAQQGSIFVFVVLVFVYTALMRRLDHRYGVDDDAADAC